jgi:hypothetical protein
MTLCTIESDGVEEGIEVLQKSLDSSESNE